MIQHYDNDLMLFQSNVYYQKKYIYVS